MIVRLMGDGQYEVPDTLRSRLNEIDDDAVKAVEQNDEAALRACLEDLHAEVKAVGSRLDDASLRPSELMVPPADLSLGEAHELFSGDGLIPDLPA